MNDCPDHATPGERHQGVGNILGGEMRQLGS
jgi:hypothetical protein